MLLCFIFLHTHTHIHTQEQLSSGSIVNKGASLGDFKVGMKLEAKDRIYPTLIAVATIADIKDGQLLIHFDGWGNDYNYWCKPKSTDIHPTGWCKMHGKELQPPKSEWEQ